MKKQQVGGRAEHHRLASGSEPSLVGAKNLGSAALDHRPAASIEIPDGGLFGSCPHCSITALGPSAAKIPGNKQIVIAAVMHDERRFDSFPIGRQTGFG